MTAERCECGAETICPQPSWSIPMKDFVAWYKAHPSRRAYVGRARASIAADAHLKKERRS